MLELLNQLDGFDERGEVKVIMATNAIDSLDPALIRPGRIDRKIEFPLPDIKTKRRIFNIHTAKMTLSDDVDIEEFVMAKDELSGADIKAVCTEAGLLALRERRMKVTQEDFRKAKEKQAEMRSFQDQRQNRTFDASTRVQAILEESDILKDLEALAEDGSEVGEDDQRPQEPGVEGKQIVQQKEEERQKTGSQKSSILTKNIGAEASISTDTPGQNARGIEVLGNKGQEETKEESRPISLPSSPEVEESLREGLGEVLTLDDSPKSNDAPQRTSAEKCLPGDVVEIIEEDVEEEGAITGFLERVPKVSVSSVDSPIYPPPPPRQLFKRKHGPVKKLRIEDPSGVKKLCLRDTSSEESEDEEDSGIISCCLDAKDSVKVKFGKLAPSKPSLPLLTGKKKMKLEKKSGRL